MTITYTSPIALNWWWCNTCADYHVGDCPLGFKAESQDIVIVCPHCHGEVRMEIKTEKGEPK